MAIEKPKETQKKALHAFVSDEAHEHWHEFAAEQGVSVSAILEALGTELFAEVADDEDRNCPITLDVVVKKARRLDAERRRRS